jgi:hypothetical protein
LAMRQLRSDVVCRWYRRDHNIGSCPEAAQGGGFRVSDGFSTVWPKPPRRRPAGGENPSGGPSCVCAVLGGQKVQVKPELGTGPLEVGGLNVQLAVRTSVSQRPNSPLAGVWSWNSRIVADENSTSSMVSVQFGF